METPWASLVAGIKRFSGRDPYPGHYELALV